MTTAGLDAPTQRGSLLRIGVWVLHLALPAAGAWLLLARPHLDLVWEDQFAHFLLVVGTAAASLAVALRVHTEARRRRDARLVLVSLSFFSSAVFLLLHGAATPGVVLPGRTSGFTVAAGVGLVIGAVFAAWSSVPLGPAHAERVLRREGQVLAALAVVATAWGLGGLLPALRQPLEAEAGGALLPLTLVGVPLYAVAVVRYWQLHRRRPAVMTISLITAFTLLAEALVVVLVSRAWHLSWWEWHLLMLAGFGFVAYSVRVQGRREGAGAPLFANVALDETLRSVREEHRDVLDSLVELLHSGASADEAYRAARRLGVTEAQATAFAHSAEATYEVDLLKRQLDTLFHLYVSPDVADSLLADPGRAELGGAVAEVTVLFADLRGFTSFAETTDPAAVVDLLNRYFRRAVPLVLGNGGMVAQFIGDAVLAVFNAPRPLDDHAFHAARTGLDLQHAIDEERGERRELPRFRVGIETGPALVGNVGGEVRSFTVIGDTPNVAARLEAAAVPGQVVIGPGARAALGERAHVEPLGPLELKGKAAPVTAYTLLSLQTALSPGGPR
jgi:adenylate cyclase